MSSSPPADNPHAAPPRRRAFTLRTTLVVSIVAVLVVLSGGFGIATEIALSNHLVEQLDSRLRSAQDQRFGPGGGPRNEPIVEPDRTQEPELIPQAGCDGPFGGQPDGSLFAVVRSGQVVSAVIRVGFGDCKELDAGTDPGVADLAGLDAADQPRTMTVDGADYRVVARSTPTGDTLVTGLSMETVSITQTRLAYILGFGAVVVCVVGAGLVFWIVRRSLRPLERVAETARAVTEIPLSSGEVDLTVRVPEADTDPRTEIGQVGAALNQMLGHVSHALESRHRSETQVRQFVADASHELRTPLASIRGYSELARRSGADPQTVAHALGRVESESARMTTLVEDLLLLARLDAGRPLARDQVDLTLLLLDRVSDARVSGPDHHWRLDLPDEPVTLPGDEQRLHQVVGNLLTNARTHTPPGSTVTTALAVVDGTAVITVTDDGPGIPTDLQPDIFGRFVRGDSSRSRAAGSTGLGLAIVSAVVHAHDGRVEVDSRPGRTRFTVMLPGAS